MLPLFYDIYSPDPFFYGGGGAACFCDPGTVLPSCLVSFHFKIFLVGLIKPVSGRIDSVCPFVSVHIFG